MTKCLTIAMVILVSVAFVFLGCGQQQPRIDKAKFEGLYRAAKTIQVSTSVGVNYLEFGKLLRNYATELSIANDRITSEGERELWNYFNKSYEMYEQSHFLWKDKIEYSKDPKYQSIDEVIQKYWKEGANELEKAKTLYLM